LLHRIKALPVSFKSVVNMVDVEIKSTGENFANRTLARAWRAAEPEYFI
jgi:hypothetical protein